MNLVGVKLSEVLGTLESIGMQTLVARLENFTLNFFLFILFTIAYICLMSKYLFFFLFPSSKHYEKELAQIKKDLVKQSKKAMSYLEEEINMKHYTTTSYNIN